MIDLSKHEIKTRVTYPGSEDEWYEIRYISPKKREELISKYKEGEKLDWQTLKYILVDWGGVRSGDEELECIEKNIKIFFKAAKEDRVQWLYEMAFTPAMFSPNKELYLKNLNGLLNTLNKSNATNGSSEIAELV